MKKYYMLLTGTMLLAVVQTKAQTKIGAAGAPDGSAMLEVTSGTSNNKGLLPPRMTTTQRNAITSPATGLMIYNTTTNQMQVNTGTPASPTWTVATATTTGWSTTGNTGTTPATEFIGTTDNQPLTVRTNNTEKMRVTATGNMGIGTNTPAAKLHVNDGEFRVTNGSTVLASPAIEVINDGGGPGNSDNIVISSYGTNTQPSIGTQSSRGTFSAPLNSEAGDNIGNFFFNARVNGSIANANVIRGVYLGDGTTNKSRLNFFTSNAIAMTIDSNSFVGIGTTAPQQRLHVAGTARITGSSGTATTIAGRNASGDVSNITVGAGLSLTGGTLTATAGGNNWGLTGNTGTAPATNFIGTTNNQPLVVRTNNTEKVRVTAAGYVGIGIDTPTTKLQVADTGDVAIRAISNTSGRTFFNLGNRYHGITRNLTGSGGIDNDVALYTSSGPTPASAGSLYLIANPIATDTLPLGQFVLKNTGHVGIGTIDPATKLHVDNGGLMITNGTTVLANPAIQVVNNGGGPGNNDNIVINSFGVNTQPSIGTQSSRGTFSAPENSQAGDNIGNFFFNARVNGSIANANVIRGVYLGDGTTNRSRLNFLTSNIVAMTIDSSRYVGIGTSAPGYRLDVAGDINASGSVRANGVALTSDARLKRNIANSSYGLNTVMDLRPVVYDKKNSIQDNDYNRHEIGFIAQEIAKVLPSLVTEGKDADKTLAVSYTELIPVLTKAIQEQQKIIETLKTELASVKTDNTALKADVSKIGVLSEKMKQLEALLGTTISAGTTASK